MPLNNGAVNQIVSFATGVANPNVQTLEEYLTDPARLGGNESGLARSPFMNRTWRQSAHMAAGLAQYIANRFEAGVLDDGNLDAIELGMATAVGISMRWNALLTYGVPSMVFGVNGKLYTALQPSGPAISGVGPKDPTAAGAATYWLDYAASITPPPAEKYDIAQYYWFEDEMPRAGLFSCLGGIVPNFAKTYPKAAAYFETEHGQKRLVEQAKYDELHVHVWHTNADGTKIGWNGIGGVNNFVWDKGKDTLLLPDLAGMTPEQVGAKDSPGVGGVHPDMLQDHNHNIGGLARSRSGGDNGAPWPKAGQWVWTAAYDGSTTTYLTSMLTNNPYGYRYSGATRVRAWISDARVYLGIPVS